MTNQLDFTKYPNLRAYKPQPVMNYDDVAVATFFYLVSMGKTPPFSLQDTVGSIDPTKLEEPYKTLLVRAQKLDFCDIAVLQVMFAIELERYVKESRRSNVSFKKEPEDNTDLYDKANF